MPFSRSNAARWRRPRRRRRWRLAKRAWRRPRRHAGAVAGKVSADLQAIIRKSAAAVCGTDPSIEESARQGGASGRARSARRQLVKEKSSMIVIEDNRLEFSFPEVHQGGALQHRIPAHPAHPGRRPRLSAAAGPREVSAAPSRRLRGATAGIVAGTGRRDRADAPGRGALWINFNSDYPFAVKVATGKICAITGESWVDGLNRDPPGLCRCCRSNRGSMATASLEGVIRQFVAMPLGEGGHGRTIKTGVYGNTDHLRVPDDRPTPLPVASGALVLAHKEAPQRRPRSGISPSLPPA